MRWCEINSALR